jgi:rhodanese-related sulfurtransferase
MKAVIPRISASLASLLLVSACGIAAAAEPSAEYPLRARYPGIPIVTTQELARDFAKVEIVDVRSQFEYDTLRVEGAKLIPVTAPGFVDSVRKLREAAPGKRIVFYCNGKTCAKSYDAAVKAAEARIPDTACYDAGIFDWAKAHPDRAALLGKSPMRPAALIDDQRFKERLLDPKEFTARVGNAVVLDIRDYAQRDNPLFPAREMRAQLDESAKLAAAFDEAKRSKKPLLVYDAVGHQVKWFQYHLEENGITDYYFMKGGAQAWYDDTLGKVKLGVK